MPAGLAPELLDVVCGLRRGTVARLESGQSRVTPLHLLRLATVLGVEIDWFFSETPLAAPHACRRRQPGPAIP
ncbi:MAG: helix-turn-helix transcriptional regulator [Rhodospirillales bacterium]